MRQAADIRAADSDRERLAAELQRHTAAGRLTIDEFSERACAAYRSRTMGELDALTADLPSDANSHRSMSISRRAWAHSDLGGSRDGASWSRGNGNCRAAARRRYGLSLVIEHANRHRPPTM